MPKFKIAVQYSNYCELTIEADTLEAAVEKVTDNPGTMIEADGDIYVEGSWNVLDEVTQQLNEEDPDD